MSDPDRETSPSTSYCWLVVAACLLAGCQPIVDRNADSGRIDVDPAAARERDVQLVSVDRQGIDTVLAKHRGQVVLVDFWATWCGPCVEQLPHTITLARQLGKRGLTVVTVSIDDPGELERVTEFLRTQGAGVATNLISQFGASPKSMEAFEITGGAVPHYKLYDRSGQLRQTFGVDPAAKNQFTQQEIDAAIESLLTE
jgi:thiol-disulfide isomerase/thioredoxin